MAGLKPKSLAWLDQLDALKAQYQVNPSVKRPQLKEALNLSDAQISILLNLKDCLDPAAIVRIRREAQGDPPYIFTFNCARALARLNGRVDNPPEAVHATLDQALSERLDPRHLKVLVAGLIDSKPAPEFDPGTVKKKKRRMGDSQKDGPEPDPVETAPPPPTAGNPVWGAPFTFRTHIWEPLVKWNQALDEKVEREGDNIQYSTSDNILMFGRLVFGLAFLYVFVTVIGYGGRFIWHIVRYFLPK
jgi:hypothetical protein